MSDSRTSTLLNTERTLRPLVLGVTAVSSTLVCALLWLSRTPQPSMAWLICAFVALALLVSNLYYLLTHALTTVGMIPVALFSLLPALWATALSGAGGEGLRRACLILSLPLAAALLLFLVWFWRLRSAYHSHPNVFPTATLIVLGGAIKRGRPCTTLARRLDVAARLWHECPTRLIVCTGGPTPSHTTTEADEMARYLRERGVSNARILRERRARNTRENIQYTRDLLVARGIRGQCCVISSDYHLWRALRDARTLGVDLTPIPAPTPAPSIPQQWCREVLTILTGR